MPRAGRVVKGKQQRGFLREKERRDRPAEREAVQEQVLRQHSAREHVIDAGAHVRDQVLCAADGALAATHAAEVEAEETEPRLARTAVRRAHSLPRVALWERLGRPSDPSAGYVVRVERRPL